MPGKNRGTRIGGAKDVVRAQVERARARMDQRRADQKIRDRRVSAAVKQFATASAAVTAREEARDRQVIELQQQIQAAHAAAAAAITELRVQQRTALTLMKEQGQTDSDIAELLDLTTRQVRQLLVGSPRTSPGAEPSTKSGRPVAEPVDLRRETLTEESQSWA
ncbi:hypothetical protein [Nocardia sp. NPDC058497]|uniref:hypothetical protein n=1 Tax=Nocardia sp. NPDC058497 TaxID=3346529 RepID=UPI0036524218